MPTKVKVRAFGHLMATLGNETVIELKSNSRVVDLLSVLRKKTEAVQKEALSRFDRTEPELTVLINGQNIQALSGLETLLRDGDLVVLLPAFHGG
ncbi:MAG: MoaD/ThiS family protein [Candidatus Bathyarchaeia archaeon]